MLENFAALAPRNGEISIVGVHKERVSFDYAQVAFNNWHIHGYGDGATKDLLPEIMAMMRSENTISPRL